MKAAKQGEIEIYKKDFENAECLSVSDSLGTCIIASNKFMSNSPSRWIINVTSPESFSCNMDTTKVNFQLMDSEC